MTDLGCLQEDRTSRWTEVIAGTLVLVASDSTLLDFQIEIFMCEFMSKLCSPIVGLKCPQTSEEAIGSPLNMTQVLGSLNLLLDAYL